MAVTLPIGERLAPARRVVTGAALRWLPPAALAAVCAYALAIIATRVFFTSPGYDDSYYGSIARNFADGRGYVTSYGESAITFNAEISVGPATLLPSAALHFLLGSHYWVNNLIVPLMALPMAAAAGWLLHKRFGVSAAGLAALALIAVIFTNERTAQGDFFRFMFLWSHLMGEVPAILFTLLAAILATMGDRRPGVHAAAGVLLGLGVYSKVFVLLTFPGFAVVYAWFLWRERDFRPVLAFAAGALAVAIPIELFRMAALGSFGAYRANTDAVIDFYRHWGSGSGDHSSPRSLVEQFSITIGIFAVVAWGALLTLDRARTRLATDQERRCLHLAALLAVAAAFHFFWWLAINDAGWVRHAVPGVMYVAVAGTLLASHARFPVTRYATAGVLAVVLVTQADAVTDYKPLTGQESRLEALLSTSDYLHETEAEGVSFWGCGWWANRDLDFVADAHFNDCLDSESVWKHLDGDEQLLLVRSEFYNWEGNPSLTALAEDCDKRRLFAEGPFSVCDATPWLRANTPRP